jgi:hypothetical protein
MKFGQTISLSVVGLLAGGSQAYAQASDSSASASASVTSSAAGAASTATSAMIPAGLSAGCSKYLDSLDKHAGFKQCVEPLYNITSNFNPLTGLGLENVTTSTVTSTLTQLCASSTKCDDSQLRSYLGQFYSACSVELTSTEASYSERIREMYDYLYIVNPFRAAVCTKDGASQKYCVLEIASQAAAASAAPNEAENATSVANSTTNAVKLNSFAATGADLFAPVLEAAQNLVIYNPISDLTRRMFPQLSARAPGDAQTSYMTPNATTYRSTSLPYLFLQADMSSKLLCSTCTKSIMAAYISWESQVPYALGLGSSPILGGQQDLWSGIGQTCGANFTDSISAQAGVSNTTGATVMGAANKLVVGQGLVSGAVLAVVGTIVASML